MTQHKSRPKPRPTQWQWGARRIRVPLGFVTAAVYVFEVARRPAHPVAIAWSLVLVLPGLALRAAASGTVKKESRTRCDRSLRLHAQSPLPGFDADGRGLRRGPAQLAAGAFARRRLRRHLHSRDCLGRAIPPRHVSGFRGLLPTGSPGSASFLAPPHSGQSPKRSSSSARSRGRQCSFQRLLLCPVSQAPRVQCCNRGRTAVFEFALPAAGAGGTPRPVR